MNALFDPLFLRGEAVAGEAGGVIAAGSPLLADAGEVARSLDPDAPVLCFSPARLSRQLARFRDGFPGEVSYAVKANSNAEVLATLAGAGLKAFDVASVEEMASVGRVATDPEFHYHNPVKSRAEIAAAHRLHGCRRFAVDCVQELSKIAEVLGSARNGVEIAVRFRLPARGASVHDFSTKFGTSENDAALLLEQARLMGFTPCITFHPGSQCRDPQDYRRHIEAAGRIARQADVTPHALNVGGGFPAPYAGSRVPEPEAYFQAIGEAFAGAFPAAARPALECEPGRALVAASTSLLARVKLVRPAAREVFINDCIYGSLLEVSQAPELTPHHRAIRTRGKALAAASAAFTIFGPTCDPLDRLPDALALPADIGEDDFIEFGMLGAYGAATATRFNGYGNAGLCLTDSVYQG